jgi:hypothetical protein
MRPKLHDLLLGVISGALLASVLACGTSVPPPTPTVNIPPTETFRPTATPLPLFRSVTLVTVPTQETSTSPAYTINAQTPSLQGSDDPRAIQFNNEMVQLTLEEIASFKDNARMIQPSPGSAGSSYIQQYEVLSPNGNLISVKFTIRVYIAGAAHPGTHSRTVTYDLEVGKDLTFGELFLPNSDYLDPIAAYCAGELEKRPIDFDSFSSGAEAMPENYANWNVSQDGLVITFDEYQVAAYAAGPQVVLVPYSELASVLSPNGPLATLMP